MALLRLYLLRRALENSPSSRLQHKFDAGHALQACILREQACLGDVCGLPNDGIRHGELVLKRRLRSSQELLFSERNNAALAHELQHFFGGSDAAVANHVFAYFINAEAGHDEIRRIKQGGFKEACVRATG